MPLARSPPPPRMRSRWRGGFCRCGTRAWSLLWRRIGDEIGQAAVDAGALGPDRRIEARRQAGLKLRRREARDAGIVGDVAGALARVGDAAGIDVPIVVGIGLLGVVADEASDEAAGAACQRSSRIGVDDGSATAGDGRDADQPAHIDVLAAVGVLAAGDCPGRVAIADRAWG